VWFNARWAIGGRRLIAASFASIFLAPTANVRRECPFLYRNSVGGTRSERQPRAGSSSRSTHRSPHDGFSRESLPMSDPHSAKSAVATPRTEWLDPRPDENVLSRTSLCATPELLRWHHSQAFAVLSKMVLLLSMACIVTASFRATATAARLNPTRSLSLSPHVRRSLSALLRVSITVAAS